MDADVRNSIWIAVTFLCSTAVATPALTIPPPVEQYTANCQYPTYASDQLICNDEELLPLDQAMAELLVKNPELAQRPESALYESQSAWLRRRSLCARQKDHAACLRTAYTDRMQLLQSVGQRFPVIGARCIAKTRSTTPELIEIRDNLVLLMDKDRVVIGLARFEAVGAFWKSYVTAKRSGRTIDFESNAGTIFKCRLLK